VSFLKLPQFTSQNIDISRKCVEFKTDCIYLRIEIQHSVDKMIIEVAEQVNQLLLHFQSNNKAASAQPNISNLKVVLFLPIDQVFCELHR